MDEEVVVPAALYRDETWNMREADGKRLNVMEMRCLRSMGGVTCLDCVRNDEVQSRTGVVRERLLEVLQWFGRVKRMEEECLVKKITRSHVRAVRLRS